MLLASRELIIIHFISYQEKVNKLSPNFLNRPPRMMGFMSDNV